jgi:hypothetical protein
MNREAEEQYLILHTFTVCGDCAIWWGPNHNGYTTDIDKAGRYTKDEADKIYRNRPKLDKPILWSKVEPMIVRHVHINKVREFAPPDLREVSD